MEWMISIFAAAAFFVIAYGAWQCFFPSRKIYVAFLLPLVAAVIIFLFGGFCFEMPNQGKLMVVENGKVVAFEQKLVFGWMPECHEYPGGFQEKTVDLFNADPGSVAYFSKDCVVTFIADLGYQHLRDLCEFQKYYDIVIKPGQTEEAYAKDCKAALSMAAKKLISEYGRLHTVENKLACEAQIRKDLYCHFLNAGLDLCAVTIHIRANAPSPEPNK